MISYADFEFAITRWKARTSGVPQPVVGAFPAGTVSAEVPVATGQEDPSCSAERASGTVSNEARNHASGSVVAVDLSSGPLSWESQ